MSEGTSCAITAWYKLAMSAATILGVPQWAERLPIGMR